MRFGNWRGVMLVAGLVVVTSASARAQGLHTIPRLAPAVDLNTGGPYYAPPIPYGHYAGMNLGGKIGGHAQGLLGKLHGLGGAGMGHGLLGKHGNLGSGCGMCGGGGCDSCLGHGGPVMGSAQSMPAMPTCDEPAGCGLFGKHKRGCGSMGDACDGGGHGSCGMCGGAGCSACAKLGGLVGHLLGRDKIKWFNGPGGPVPLTPGYTPYINVTRSPRDFFAFPPRTPE